MEGSLKISSARLASSVETEDVMRCFGSRPALAREQLQPSEALPLLEPILRLSQIYLTFT